MWPVFAKIIIEMGTIHELDFFILFVQQILVYSSSSV